MTTAIELAKERQLDWLLDEGLGRSAPDGPRAAKPAPRAASRQQWLAAALVVLATAAAFGVAVLRGEPDAAATQSPPGDPPVEWTEARGAAGLASVPADVRNLRCFDFDDAAMAGLARFTQLQRLDLGGLAVNEQGWSAPPKLTDAGLVHLRGLTGLQWLSLASCHDVHGPGLTVLEGLPRLEHLDLSSTQVDSAAVERLPRLPSLRELSLSWCRHFHGRSLAAVATIPGLRRLELWGCTTVTAADVVHLAELRELRYLDLTDCCGRFRGQTMSMGTEPPAYAPKDDGIGVTDASVARLVGLPLETLRIGGCDALTDAVGDTLARLPSLRILDLAHLPKITGALLGKLPNGLHALRLDECAKVDGAALRRLPELPHLLELGLSGLPLRDDDVAAVLADRRILILRLGGEKPSLGNEMRDRLQPQLTAATAAALAAQRALQRLDLSHAVGVDAAFLARIAELPKLQELRLTLRPVTPALLQPLGRSRTLATLDLMYSSEFDPAALRELRGAPLRHLDLYATRLDPAKVREIAPSWPGCTIKLADGQLLVVPAK